MSARLLKLAVIAPAVLLLLVVLQGDGAPRAYASAVVQGDVNCSGTADTIDSLQVILMVAELDASTDCVDDSGDVNCDDAVDAADSLRILRYVHDNDEMLGCTPQTLAERLYEAADPADANALLVAKVFPALDIGVYTGDGEQIVDGAEVNLDTDFYLYDLEIELMTGNYVARQGFGLTTLATFLNGAGLVDEGTGDPLTNMQVLALLADKIAAARSDPSMFVWRLIDELGLVLEEPLDLTDANLDPERVSLDVLQIFLALHDLTVPLHPVSAANEVQATDAVADSVTQMLHDFAMFADGHVLNADPVPPTHWSHGDDTEVTRVITATFDFNIPADVRARIRSGPLSAIAVPNNGPVPGALTVWYALPPLPNNGHMVPTPGFSERTDADGKALNAYLPNLECPKTAGTGNVVTESGTVEIWMYTPYKSNFPPYATLGVIDPKIRLGITVGHHDGAGAQAAADGVAIESTEPVDPFPCQWSGTAHSDIHHFYQNSYDAVGGMDATFTYSMTKFYGTVAEYRIASGSATWREAGQFGDDCHWDRAGTDQVSGTLTLVRDSGGQVTYGGTGNTVGGNYDTCSQIPVATGVFFSTCGVPLPVLTGLDMSGSCTNDLEGQWHDEFRWNLVPGPCPGAASVTAQDGGTCGGAASFPRFW